MSDNLIVSFLLGFMGPMLYLAALILFVVGISQRRIWMLVAAVVLVALGSLPLIYGSYFVTHVPEYSERGGFVARSEAEVYESTLGLPPSSCVELLHTADRDFANPTSVWLHFSGCRSDIKSILAQHSVASTGDYRNLWATRSPVWWRPQAEMRYAEAHSAEGVLGMFISIDSTEVYCTLWSDLE